MSFICPFCQSSVAENPMTHLYRYETFERPIISSATAINEKQTHLRLDTFKCSECGRIFFSAEGHGEHIEGLHFPIFPRSNCKQFPEYVPAPIRQDYQEACDILHLSPKASATLARRCLQGMIRDFWGISKGRLIDEVNALQEVVPPHQWKAIDAVRKIGNIGAHMEKDVNFIIDISAEDAETLLKLIERLITRWYVDRYEEEALYQDVIRLPQNK